MRVHVVLIAHSPDLFDKQERVEAVLAGRGLDGVDTGLRYLLSDPRVSIILSGVDSVEELETSVAVSDGRCLDDDLIQAIDNDGVVGGRTPKVIPPLRPTEVVIRPWINQHLSAGHS